MNDIKLSYLWKHYVDMIYTGTFSYIICESCPQISPFYTSNILRIQASSSHTSIETRYSSPVCMVGGERVLGISIQISFYYLYNGACRQLSTNILLTYWPLKIEFVDNFDKNERLCQGLFSCSLKLTWLKDY